MSKLCLLLLLTLVLIGVGCASEPPSGNREYVPGKGWVPVPNE